MLFRSCLAQYLVSEQARSQPVGLGPQTFDTTSAQAPIAPTIMGQLIAASTSDRSKPDVMTESVSHFTTIQSDAATKPMVDTLDLYLRHALPPAPDFIPAEWRAIIAAAISQPRTLILGGVGTGKTQVLYAIADDLRQAGKCRSICACRTTLDTPPIWTSFSLLPPWASSGKNSKMNP